MSFGDYLYIVALFGFVYLTFGIVRNYYRNKFNDEGKRIDMLDDDEAK